MSNSTVPCDTRRVGQREDFAFVCTPSGPGLQPGPGSTLDSSFEMDHAQIDSELTVLRESPGNRATRLPVVSVLDSPIARLPPELLGEIFNFVLPFIDDGLPIWHHCAYHPHMRALHHVQSVCQMWRSVADSTPYLWTTISSTFPFEVIKKALQNSGTLPLRIHCLGGPVGQGDSDSILPFWNLVNPSSYRWYSVEVHLSYNVESFTLPANSTPTKLQIAWPEHGNNNLVLVLSKELLQAIRILDLDGAELDWSRSMPQLQKLRSLALVGDFGQDFTADKVLDVLSASPDLEALKIVVTFKQDIVKLFSRPLLERIHLERLRSLILNLDEPSADIILRGIEPVSKLTHLEIRHPIQGSRFSSVEERETFWMQAVAAWAPAIRDLYHRCTMTIKLLQSGPCSFKCPRRRADNWLTMDIHGLPITMVLGWIECVVGPQLEGENGEGDGIHVELRLAGEPLVDTVVDSLESMKGLTKLTLVCGERRRCPEVPADLGYLFTSMGHAGGINKMNHSNAQIKSNFPNLRRFVIRDWSWDLDAVVDMVRQRYFTNFPAGYRILVPDLELKLQSEQPMPKYSLIYPFSVIKGLRAMDGVKAVTRRYLYVERSGMVAVVWDEDASTASWG